MKIMFILSSWFVTLKGSLRIEHARPFQGDRQAWRGILGYFQDRSHVYDTDKHELFRTRIYAEPRG